VAGEGVDRSKESALEVLLEVRSEVAESLMNNDARSVLTEGLLRDVFVVSWNNQFEEDRRAARRELRQLVTDAIEERFLAKEER
jgi:hypothetical protein